jgi:hypothetical protein
MHHPQKEIGQLNCLGRLHWIIELDSPMARGILECADCAREQIGRGLLLARFRARVP